MKVEIVGAYCLSLAEPTVAQLLSFQPRLTATSCFVYTITGTYISIDNLGSGVVFDCIYF